MMQSRLVLARSGYSTVMDLVRLGKRAIYIPTPGQPEQEYLGGYLEEQGWGICRRQRGFVLAEAMERMRGLGDRELGRVPDIGGDGMLGEEIKRVLAQSAAGDLG
jgi:UDP-N-acetylglucosamine:LPS N-acetylglucosamine transferase